MVPIEVDLSTTSLAEFEELINFYANENGLDPLDVAALVLTESDGNPNVVAKSGAVGLCQVMAYEAGPVFNDRPTVAQLTDPATNLHWGCSIMAYYLKKQGNVHDALYYYSGGKYWNGVGNYEKIYWNRFLQKRKDLVDAGVKYKSPQDVR
jgi:soluble lytic murein transglycosylase-like protein